MGQLFIVGAVEVDGEVWPLSSGEQPESVLGQPGDGGQVDGAETGEPVAEQLVKWRIEDGEDGDVEEWLAVQRPGAGCALRMGSQLVRGITASPDNQCRGAGRSFARNRDRCSVRSPGIRQGYRRIAYVLDFVPSHAVNRESGRRESNPHDQLGRLRIRARRPALPQLRVHAAVPVSNRESP